jgi:hypothetical protein
MQRKFAPQKINTHAAKDHGPTLSGHRNRLKEVKPMPTLPGDKIPGNFLSGH